VHGVFLFVVLAVAAPAGLAQEVEDHSFVTAEGQRIQRLEIDLDAPVAQVWALLATSEGLRSWMAPVVEIELRNGGRWEASYDATRQSGDPGNIVNEVLAFIPERLLVLQVRSAPPDYPLNLSLVQSARAVFELEPIDAGRTRVSVTGVGYGTGPEWDAIYSAGIYGNRVSLIQLQERIESGPTDWASRQR